MHYLLLIVILIIIILGPNIWVKHVIKKHSRYQTYPGTGSEFARHLIEKLDLGDLQVEETDHGDHYDPVDKTVRLSKDIYHGKSLASITIAAHEVGHAIQDKMNMPTFRLRCKLVGLANQLQKIGSLIMMLMPMVALVTKVPSSGIAMFVVGLSIMLSASLVHLLTLSVEKDASFNKAMPILLAGDYINDGDQAGVKSILTAAVYTYFAASLMTLLNFYRWLRLWRR